MILSFSLIYSEHITYMNKLSTTFIGFLFISIIIGVPTVLANTSADQNCQPIYGGGQRCEDKNHFIDKKVKNPTTGNFEDSVSTNASFTPGSDVMFQITVINPTNTTISRMQVQDKFPARYVKFIAGSGKFENNTLSYEITDLKPGEARTTTISAKIAASNELPNDMGTTCVVNQAFATVDNVTKQDDASFCIEKQVLGAKTPTTKGGLKVFPAPKPVRTPATGAEAIALFGIIPSALTGLLIRKKAIN
jgi:hypothetical protein